ncbi:FIST signal transduction protein [Clostridium vitabionis]|uniref:FIST signal transduction protein n=1 Tax=Clostridium vitabionis TaxID=2784388 RepID=UPI00188D55C3|nr:FIST N-terminal domain-containing protein [Clostridium vitabionis]
MLKAIVAVSTSADAAAAAKEIAGQLERKDLKAVFAYCSCDYDVHALISSLGKLVNAPVFGNTSFTGIITQDGFIGGSQPFVGAMALADPDLTVGVAALPKDGCSIARGKELAILAKKAAGRKDAPDYFYMAASPAEEEFYAEGIAEEIGRVPFFGGSAADNTIEGKWLLYAGDQCFADGCVTAFFYGGPKTKNLFTGAYRETDDFGVITKIQGNRTICAIDGVPALKKYQEWRGLPDDAVLGGNLLGTSVVSPLGVKDRLGKLVAIRHPMFGNEDWTINVGNNLAEKTTVIRMEASVDELIASAGETLKALMEKTPGKITAFHLVHCGGRRAAIGDRIGEVAAGLKEAAGNIPFLAEFTFGEYGVERDDVNACGGLMLSFTAFYE